MAHHATPRTFSPLAEELYQEAIRRGYPHCELLNKAADELKRLWNVAEDRYWANQRLEGALENLEEAVNKYRSVMFLSDNQSGEAMEALLALVTTDETEVKS